MVDGEVPVGLGCEAEGFDVAGESGDDVHALGEFVLDEEGAVGVDLAGEGVEGFDDVVDAVVDIEVVGFDVEDDGVGGVEVVEGSCVFAGLGDEYPPPHLLASWVGVVCCGGSFWGSDAVTSAYLGAVGADDE